MKIGVKEDTKLVEMEASGGRRLWMDVRCIPPLCRQRIGLSYRRIVFKDKATYISISLYPVKAGPKLSVAA